MKQIKQLRILCNIKQYKLAEMLGMQQTNYSKIENGKLIPNNLGIIKHRAKNILLPKLDALINKKKLELKELKYIRHTFD